MKDIKRLQATSANKPQTKKRAPAHPRSRRAASERATRELAEAPDILDVFADDVAGAGLVGESRNARTLMLILVSRLLTTPASAEVTGHSSSGKSRLVGTVVSFFPPDAFIEVSSLSPKALAYFEEELRHRILVIAEAAGVADSYLLRTLLSEHVIRHVTVETTENGFRQVDIRREGPTGVIYTTTGTASHPENATRLLTLAVSDTPAQSRAVLTALAAGDAKDAVDRRRWHALHSGLGDGPQEVGVPFAPVLATLIPESALQHPRIRRDFATVLTLVRAHALLHRASRRFDRERVVAAIDDYAAVRDLVGDVVGQAVGRTVEPEVRETVAAVRRVYDDSDDYVQVGAVAEVLGLHKSAASRRVAKAVAAGYIRNIEARRGRPAQLVLADAMPEDEPVLPPVDAVREAGGCAVERLPPTKGVRIRKAKKRPHVDQRRKEQQGV